MKAGQTGELVVRGSHVARGYWGDPALTAQRFRPGRFPGETVLHTGDLFQMDEEGYLHFKGRKDDLIKSRGEKVSPQEIENVVCQMPQVEQAAVVGVPDEILGQAILLVVALRSNGAVDVENIRNYCARNLLRFMTPKYVQIVEQLPGTANGKVDKKTIAQRWSESQSKAAGGLAKCAELQGC
jgi:acyl-CoA synthetase (AMP-forming)/AMP-acid ligase II